MLLTYALSARNFIEDIGSYAGFAAVVALALFALLLFAQARELKRLRDWGGQAHDRIGELERSVAAALDLARRAQSQPRGQAQGTTAAPARGAVARGRAAAGPAAAVAAGGPPRQAGAATARPAVASTAAPVRPQLLPSAPVGVGGPALASATALIPLPGAPGSPAVPSAPAQPQRVASPGQRPAGQPAVAASVAGQRGRAVPAAGAGAPAAAGARARDAGAPPPPSGSNGHHDDDISEEYEQLPPRRVPPPPPRRAAGAGAGPGARPRPGGRPQPAAPLRGGGGGGASRAVLPSDSPPPHGRRRLAAVIAGVVALLVVGVVVVIALTGGDDRTPVRVQTPVGNGRAQGRSTRQQARTTPAPPHDQTTVAVLNGTQTGGLASTVMTELTGADFREGTVTNASDPNRSVTVVSFRAGKEREAQEVARTLRLSADAVQEIDAGTEAIACANTTPCTVDVVVTVGADRQPTQ